MTEMDLVRLLENRHLGTRNQDLFIGYTPPSPNVITVVRLYPGLPPQKRFGARGVAYEFPRAQLLFRGDPEALEATLERGQKAHDVYMEVEAEPLDSGDLYHRIQPLGPPTLLRYDENQRPEVVLNLHIEKER